MKYRRRRKGRSFRYIFLVVVPFIVYLFWCKFRTEEVETPLPVSVPKQSEKPPLKVTTHHSKTNLRSQKMPEKKYLVIGIVAACVQDRFYRFIDINKEIRTWDVLWKSTLEFVALEYMCKDSSLRIDYPSDIYGYTLRTEKANKPFSRASNINQMMSMMKHKNTVFLAVDVDIQIIQHVLWKIKKYVKPGSIYFPKIWSNYNPQSINLIKTVTKFDTPMYSSYQGTWRKYGYGMFAIHKSDFPTHLLNETFVGWGGEDKEYYQRVKKDKNITIIRWQEPHLIHVWHLKDCQTSTSTLKKYQDCMSSRSNYDASKLGMLLMSSQHVRLSNRRVHKLDSAFVCITGQIKRLELESKLNRLFRPLLSTFKRVHVGLALHSGETRYTNAHSSTMAREQSDFMSIGEAKSKLKRSGIKDVFFEEPTFPHVELNSIIVNQYDKAGRGSQYRQSRARNHVRQYQTIKTCSNILSKLDIIPEISIRVRDDAYIAHFDIDESLRKLHFEHTSMFIVTEDCAAWHGINDKFALVSGKVSEALFEAPMKHYPSDIVPTWVINPETFFMHSYLMEGLQTITSDSIQIVTSTPTWNEKCWKMVPRGVADCEKQIITQTDDTIKCISDHTVSLENIIRNTVITIKTFERPECLLALLRSIKLLPQPIDVIIGDDSLESSYHEALEILGDWLVSYMHLPYDSGTGAGRNKIVQKAIDLGYEYFIMSDDDYIIQNPSIIESMIKTMIHMPDADVVAPQRCEDFNDCHMGYSGFLRKHKNDLYMFMTPPASNKIIKTDVVQQFFIAKTSIGPVWDDRLKCNDHYDAMLTLKKQGRNLYTDFGLHIFHNKMHCQSPNNVDYRLRRKNNWLQLMPYVLKKWHISKYYDEFGRVWEIDGPTQQIKTQCGVLCTKKPTPSVLIDGIKWTYGKCQYFTKNKRKYNTKDCPLAE